MDPCDTHFVFWFYLKIVIYLFIFENLSFIYDLDINYFILFKKKIKIKNKKVVESV